MAAACQSIGRTEGGDRAACSVDGMAEDPDNTQVRSVDRAVSLLYLLADVGPTRVTDVARKLGTHKSTASRLLSTLQARGLVDREAETGNYRLGYGVVRLAGAVDHDFALGAASRPVCVELANETGETVNVVILDDDHTMCVDQVIGSASVTSVNWVGKRTPAHAVASGKVLLAHLGHAAAADALPATLVALTPRTITDREVLLASFDEIVARGWASAMDEQEPGLTSVAAPVRRPDGRVVAAVAVSGPSFRLTEDRVQELGDATSAAARRISAGTGRASAAVGG